MSRVTSIICFLTAALGATTALAQLATPTISQLKVVNGDLSVTAAPVTGATSYEGQISWTNQAGLNELRRSLTASSTGVLFRSGELPTNTPVNVVVYAVDRDGRKSGASAPARAVTGLAAPTGVAGTPGRLRIAISWNPVLDATSYRLSLSNGMSFITTSPNYIVTGLPTATSYNAIVWAIRANGESSAPSAAAVVKTANIQISLD